MYYSYIVPVDKNVKDNLFDFLLQNQSTRLFGIYRILFECLQYSNKTRAYCQGAGVGSV